MDGPVEEDMFVLCTLYRVVDNVESFVQRNK